MVHRANRTIIHKCERCAHISSIAFAHHKGGTGKTTSCLNIGGFLQKSGERVLIVDSDPQANATSGLGIDPFSRSKNMYDVFMGVFEGYPDVSLEDTIVSTPSGIDLVPSSLDLVGVEPFLYNIDDRAGILKELLEPVGEAYDHILIDTPPSMGQFVINGLVAADKTIVTLDSGIFALRGIEALGTIFDDIEEIIGGEVVADLAILTRWNGKEAADPPASRLGAFLKRLLYGDDGAEQAEEERRRFDAIAKEVRDLFSMVYQVPYDRRIYEAQQQGLPISHYAPACPAAVVYREIADVVRSW
jgi:chromosome partitioning protein